MFIIDPAQDVLTQVKVTPLAQDSRAEFRQEGVALTRLKVK